MFFQIKSYLRFLLKSTNEHGVHSPFVFDLVTKCFYDNKHKEQYQLLDAYRRSLLSDDNVIYVKDFGAGSKVFKSDARKISKIAALAGVSKKRARLLYRISAYFKPDFTLELGTSLGLATSALSLGSPAAKLRTLEGCPETARISKQQFEKFGFKNIELIVTDFDSYLQDCIIPSVKFGVVYFDGNHQFEATLKYFDLLLPTTNESSVWIFDDIHWSAEMENAWEHIKKHPAVTVTIDTFQWGIVFFRKGQEKEHFTIRA